LEHTGSLFSCFLVEILSQSIVSVYPYLRKDPGSPFTRAVRTASQELFSVLLKSACLR
jgi:hypothetical protein